MNIICNYKTIYYSFITNFYLILNLFLPLYDSVIISMHNRATMNLFGDIKKIKRIRMIDFLNELDSKDKLILDKNNNLLVVEYNYSDNIDNIDNSDNIDNIDNIDNSDNIDNIDNSDNSDNSDNEESKSD